VVQVVVRQEQVLVLLVEVQPQDKVLLVEALQDQVLTHQVVAEVLLL
jgi:hypothetical protein